MCGIVGLYLKNQELQPRLGELFTPMLVAMTDRGPDSAGFAIYRDEVSSERLKMTLRHNDDDFAWQPMSDALSTALGVDVQLLVTANIAIIKLAAVEQSVRQWLAEHYPEVLVLSVGTTIEILKEKGLPQAIADKFALSSMAGSHIIGHTRMATESAVTTAGSHPFSTGSDLCLVHNGSLSNHNRLRDFLMREGISFATDNDSEVAAGYLSWCLQNGYSLQQSLERALQDLDGFFTFAIGTKEGFAVMRDPIACKPAVLAETDDFVAMASEYQALSTLPGIEQAKVWEPAPATFYIWERAS